MNRAHFGGGRPGQPYLKPCSTAGILAVANIEDRIRAGDLGIQNLIKSLPILHSCESALIVLGHAHGVHTCARQLSSVFLHRERHECFPLKLRSPNADKGFQVGGLAA